MQLLPQQSEVDEKSLKKISHLLSSKFRGFKNACLKPFQPRIKCPDFLLWYRSNPLLRQLGGYSKATVEDLGPNLEWETDLQVFADLNAGLLQFLPVL